MILRDEITHEISDLDIAGYLLEEVVVCLDHLNYFKLTNLKDNLDAFKTYLLILDQENTKQIESALSH